MKPFVLLALLAAVASAQEVPMTDPPKLTITATVREEPNKKDPKVIFRTVRASGEAAYPDGAALQLGMRLKEDQNFLSWNQGFVSGGKWEIEMMAFGDNIYKGVYVVQVMFDPELQPPGITGKLKADKRGRNSANVEQQIGTAAEMEAEKAAVLSWYKRTLVDLHEGLDPIFTAFQAQQSGKDEKAWRAAVDVATTKLTDLDREMSIWRVKRMNVLMHDIYDRLVQVILTSKDTLFEQYTASMNFERRKRPPQAAYVETETRVKELLAKLDADLAAVKPAPRAEEKK